MNVLVIGSGGREHALALALAADPSVDEVHTAPGNPGTWQLSASGTQVVPGSDIWRAMTSLNPVDAEAVVALARTLDTDLVVIGPEAPLVAGVADHVRDAGIPCFGPGADAARLEGSKQFAKEVMAAAGVPTARSHYCRTPEQAAAALDDFGPPYVVKDDGLAAGKGVVVTHDRAEALAHAAQCESCVIEEYLDGPEVSLFAICDGSVAVPLLPAQDFKRVGDGDTGPNTGGMGAYAPLGWTPKDLTDQTMARVIRPVLAEMAGRGTPFQGLLYAGLALTSRGLRVVEFNVRFGDPETEAVLPQLATPLATVLYAAATTGLDPWTTGEQAGLTWRDGSSITVIAAATGYPGKPLRGGRIRLPDVEDSVNDNVQVIHCGTGLDDQGNLIATGGRVLAVTAHGDDLRQARSRAYAYLDRVDFPDGFYRSDIAAKAEAGLISTPSSL